MCAQCALCIEPIPEEQWGGLLTAPGVFALSLHDSHKKRINDVRNANDIKCKIAYKWVNVTRCEAVGGVSRLERAIYNLNASSFNIFSSYTGA